MPRPPIPEFGEQVRPMQAPLKPAPTSVTPEKPERMQWKRELVSTSKLNKMVRVGFYVLIVLAFVADVESLFWIAVVLGVVHSLTDKQLSIWHLKHEEPLPEEPVMEVRSAAAVRGAVREERPPAA